MFMHLMHCVALMTEGKRMPLSELLTVIIVLLILSAFIALWIFIFGKVWDSKGPNPPEFNDAILYLTPILTALVGGVVAIYFGVQLSGAGREFSLLQRFGAAASSLFSFTPDSWVFGAYAIAYLLIGIAGAVIWILRAAVTPSILRNFVMSVVGMFVAIVSGAFGIPKP